MTTDSIKKRLAAIEPPSEPMKFVVTIGEAPDNGIIKEPVKVTVRETTDE
ncbi:MAG: hypothetical protein AAFN63_01570 [Pseudomonadota bacterium]